MTRETILFSACPAQPGVGDTVRTVGGLRSERWAPSDQNAGRHQIGMGGRLTLESAPQPFDRHAPLPRNREGASSYVRSRQAREISCVAPVGRGLSVPGTGLCQTINASMAGLAVAPSHAGARCLKSMVFPVGS